jgi:glycosyltransferase involved in cell wall biosynthesis
MRIAIFHNQPSGGARRALHGLARELHRRHRVDVFRLSSADTGTLLDEEVADAVATLTYEPEPPVRGGLYLNDLRRRRNRHRLEALGAEAAQRVDGGVYDAVLVDVCRFLGAPPILDRLGTPSVYYCQHRLRPRAVDTWRAPAGAYARARRLWHLPFEQAYDNATWDADARRMRAATVVAANSEFTRLRLSQLYGIQAVVCPPGVDLKSAGAGGDYVLAVGALEAHKGHDLVVSALGLLPAAFRPPLVVAANDGNPEVRRRLEALAGSLGVRLSIRLRQTPVELDSLYAGAAVLGAGGRGEPLGLAPLEAMAHARPVVALDEGGHRETVRDGISGYLVRDAPHFAERLAGLLGSPSMRRDMGCAGRDVVARDWAWPARAEAMERALAGVARRVAGALPA